MDKSKTTKVQITMTTEQREYLELVSKKELRSSSNFVCWMIEKYRESSGIKIESNDIFSPQIEWAQTDKNASESIEPEQPRFTEEWFELNENKRLRHRDDVEVIDVITEEKLSEYMSSLREVQWNVAADEVFNFIPKEITKVIQLDTRGKSELFVRPIGFKRKSLEVQPVLTVAGYDIFDAKDLRNFVPFDYDDMGYIGVEDYWEIMNVYNPDLEGDV